MDINVAGVTLTNLASINVLIGKNGCGKSTVLRRLDANRGIWTHVKYISPERGGKAEYAPHIENNMQSSPTWLDETRRQNHDEQFREKSIAQLKNLETLVNRGRSDDARDGKPLGKHFDEVLGLINGLLDKVMLATGDKPTPTIKGKDSSPRDSSQLSSGEKELISLASEILYFVYQIDAAAPGTAKALLLMDEPDVHLHPDLQYRLMQLLVAVTAGKPITIIISTHSTAILSALSESANVHFMKSQQPTMAFVPIDEHLKTILPIFGAHPLSNIFNHNPILLVEGEDDERIWQQAVRSSEGRIALWPCGVDSIDNLNDYENRVSALIDSIYDDAKAYSLRDRDDGPHEIDDKPNVIRFRLNCYAMENLILSDDVLELLGTNWVQMQKDIRRWLISNPEHPKFEEMGAFAAGFDRKNSKVKDLRLIFIYLANSNKPWEVVVGQAIAKLSATSAHSDGSLADFLGEKVVANLKLC